MNGPEHYREAESALEASDYQRMHWGESGNRDDLRGAMWELQRAQVHATLALAAATALNDGDGGTTVEDYHAWKQVASVTAEAVTS